jgi:hypothetical protein
VFVIDKPFTNAGEEDKQTAVEGKGGMAKGGKGEGADVVMGKAHGLEVYGVRTGRALKARFGWGSPRASSPWAFG